MLDEDDVLDELVRRHRAKDGRCECEAYRVARLLRAADERTAQVRREAAERGPAKTTK